MTCLQKYSYNNPLSPASYRSLEWNNPIELSDIILNDPLKQGASIRKEKSYRHVYAGFILDQGKMESMYRRQNAIPFLINPKNYSLDCQEEASKIQRQLLRYLGTDDVIINDPEYFENSFERFAFINNIYEEKRIKERQKTEIKRSHKISHVFENEADIRNRMTLKLCASVDEIDEDDCIDMNIKPDSECESFKTSTTQEEDLDVTVGMTFLQLFQWAKNLIISNLINKEYKRYKENTVSPTPPNDFEEQKLQEKSKKEHSRAESYFSFFKYDSHKNDAHKETEHKTENYMTGSLRSPSLASDNKTCCPCK